MKLNLRKKLSMQNEFVFGLIFVILFILFAVWQITSSQKKDTLLFNKLQKEYDQVTIETAIKNNLNKTYYNPEWRGGEFSQYITLDDGRKFALRVDDCISHNEIWLNDIFPKKVRLIKNKGSDTLIILDGKKEYVFILKLKEK